MIIQGKCVGINLRHCYSFTSIENPHLIFNLGLHLNLIAFATWGKQISACNHGMHDANQQAYCKHADS